jgi:hypothetical protein
MKFLALTSLAAGAFAGVIVQRDIATIQAAMTAAGDGIVNLNSAVDAFNGDVSAVLSASNALVQALKDGKAKVEPTGELSLTDALGLQAPSAELQKKGDALLAALKAKKDAIAQNGLCEVTYTQASTINVESKALIDTVVSKVPEAAQGIAKSIVAGLLKALQDAEDTFSPTNCINTGNPPASSTVAPPATSTVVPPETTTVAPPETTTVVPPETTTVVPPQTSTVLPPVTTTYEPPVTGTCPAASTVTVTAIDSNDCTPTPTCTKKPPVTVTTTKKGCPTKAKLPW